MFMIDMQSKTPIFEQLKRQIIDFIAIGILNHGDQLPSVRQLASQLGINPNTVSKAYKNLEQDGVIYSVVGKGSFVMENISIIDSKKAEALKNISNSVELAVKLGVQKKEVSTIVDNVYGKELKK